MNPDFVSQQLPLIVFISASLLSAMLSVIPWGCDPSPNPDDKQAVARARAKARRVGGTYRVPGICTPPPKGKITAEWRQKRGDDAFLLRRTVEGNIAVASGVALLFVVLEKFMFQSAIDDRDMTTNQMQAAFLGMIYFYALGQMVLNRLSSIVPRMYEELEEEAEKNSINSSKEQQQQQEQPTGQAVGNAFWHIVNWSYSWFFVVLVILFGLSIEIYAASCTSCTSMSVPWLRRTLMTLILAFIMLDSMSAIYDYMWGGCSGGSLWVWFFLSQIVRMVGCGLMIGFMWQFVDQERNAFDHTIPVGAGDSTTDKFAFNQIVNEYLLALVTVFQPAVDCFFSMSFWRSAEDIKKAELYSAQDLESDSNNNNGGNKKRGGGGSGKKSKNRSRDRVYSSYGQTR